MASKLKMFTLTHIKHKPIGRYAVVLIQKTGKSTNCTTDEDDCNVAHIQG